METTTATGITVDKFGNHRCTECERFTNKPGIVAIKHANYCDSKAQPVTETVSAPKSKWSTPTVREAVRNGAVSAVATDDEILQAVRDKRITNDDAMNRDF